MPRPQRLHPRSAAGFTFIEVLIVVIVLGIIAALAAPMFGQTDTTRLVQAARLLAADVAYAQVESIAHGDDPRLVVFTLNSPTYFLAAASAPTTPITNPIDHGPYTTTFGTSTRARELAGVTVSAYSLNGDNKLGFGIYGQLDQTANATVTLSNNSGAVTVTIDAVSGEPSIGAVN